MGLTELRWVEHDQQCVAWELRFPRFTTAAATTIVSSQWPLNYPSFTNLIILRSSHHINLHSILNRSAMPLTKHRGRYCILSLGRVIHPCRCIPLHLGYSCVNICILFKNNKEISISKKIENPQQFYFLFVVSFFHRLWKKKHFILCFVNIQSVIA